MSNDLPPGLGVSDIGGEQPSGETARKRRPKSKAKKAQGSGVSGQGEGEPREAAEPAQAPPNTTAAFGASTPQPRWGKHSIELYASHHGP